MSYDPTGAWEFTKRLQYIEESTYGTTPTSSPSFTSAGVIQSFNETLDEALERYRQIGSRKVYKFLETGELYSFEVVYAPISTAFMRYGTEDPGGAGTIEKALSFVYSQDLSGTEHYTFLEGARTDRIRAEITPDTVQISQNFICQNITTPTTSHGLTTPDFADADTASPFVGPTGGSNPFTHNSLNYDVDRFVFEVGWALDAIKPNGATQIQFLVPTNKTVTGEFDVLAKDTALLADQKALTARAATYDLDNANSKTATFTDMVLIGMTVGHQATANTARRDTFRFEAQDVGVTAP